MASDPEQTDLTPDFKQVLSSCLSSHGEYSILSPWREKKRFNFFFCFTAFPFNCKALTGSGQAWQGHLSLLTFLNQFPRKCLFMCTWKEADLWSETGMTQRRPVIFSELFLWQAELSGKTEPMLWAYTFSLVWPNMDNDLAKTGRFLSGLLPLWVSPSVRRREVSGHESHSCSVTFRGSFSVL